MRNALLFLALASSFGCGGSAGPPPRDRNELFVEKQNMPRLYLTNDTHTRVIAPKHKGNFVDEATGEECWPALQCVNPDCPGRTAESPYLFTTHDVKTYNGCPACAKKRNYKADSKQQIAENLKFIQPYDLPEVAARAKAIDEEIQRTFDYERKVKR